MARWKVTAKHYIHAEQYGQPTEWERQETNQQTGRMFRKAYKVPMFIDPDDPFCLNKHEGFCVVARKGTEKPGDIVFFGPPTMDMEPLDDDAQAETDAEKHKWIDPVESLPLQIGEEAGQTILRALEQKIAAIGLHGVNASLRGAPNSDVDDLRKMILAQQEMINKLMAGTAPVTAAPPLDAADPPIEPDVPLADIDPEALPKAPPIQVNRPRNAMRRAVQ